jgi:hypothetical protein
VSGPDDRVTAFEITVVDNPAPNDAERRLARDIAYALRWYGSIADDPTNLAGMLALVRDGYTLEGPRKLVSGHATIPRQVYAGPDGQRAIEAATTAAWRSWFAELVRGGLRPCGWPAVQRTYLAFGLLSDNPGRPYVEFDDPDDAELLMLSVTCEAVPA